MTKMLTEHFSLDELIFSETATRKGIRNIPNALVGENLLRLCTDILEPLRAFAAEPIVITSGYRSPELNAEIGGSPSSDHCIGLAADLIIPGRSPVVVCNRIVALKLPFKQVICEFGKWTHVSLDLSKSPKREVLTAKLVDGKTRYTTGLA